MIHLRHITVRKQGKDILDDLSLDIAEGENVAIIGPNGSGKSTLVHVLTHQMHPVQVEGMEKSIFGKSRWNVYQLRKQIGIVSDSLAELCNTTYKAEDIVVSGFFSSIGIDFYHQVNDEMRSRSMEMMEFMGVGHLGPKPMNRLSSGEARRVLIARALVHDPGTLILDEPVSNLDLKTQKQFKERVRDVARNGKHIILVTHDLAEIIPEIERVIIMKQGKLFTEGKKEEILTPAILSEVFDTKVFVDHHEGWYKAWC